MKYRQRTFYTDSQKSEMWDRWQRGQPMVRSVQVGKQKKGSSIFPVRNIRPRRIFSINLERFDSQSGNVLKSPTDLRNLGCLTMHGHQLDQVTGIQRVEVHEFVALYCPPSAAAMHGRREVFPERMTFMD